MIAGAVAVWQTAAPRPLAFIPPSSPHTHTPYHTEACDAHSPPAPPDVPVDVVAPQEEGRQRHVERGLDLVRRYDGPEVGGHLAVGWRLVGGWRVRVRVSWGS